MASQTTGIVRANRYCCVVGCSNSEKKNPELNFYCFPNCAKDAKRKEVWIMAVNRCDDNGHLWQPRKFSRICSAHFKEGKKSDDPNSASYHPSIFPDVYYRVSETQTTGLEVKRLWKKCCTRPVGTTGTTLRTNDEVKEDVDIEMPDAEISTTTLSSVVEEEVEQTSVTMSTVGCQTDPWWDQSPNEANILFCSTNGNESSSQTEIFIRKVEPVKPVKIEFPTKPKMIDTACGPDTRRQCDGFMGFGNINTDKAMRQLAGVTCEFFSVLLSFILVGQYGQPAFFRALDKENRLLLFLMKMKLGISFCALGCLFHVSTVTASAIFNQVLVTLTEKTKTWICSPSRESVQAKMPGTFYNYPNCRCIIDCTEIRTDTPPSVESRALMYSNYKGGFTLKYLIAVTPDGFICKVSGGYGGRATDSFITNDCGFLELIEPGDLVLADKGFSQISSGLSKRNATLVMPPFAHNPQFTSDEVDDTYKIASVRIHVEHAIQRIKIFRVLDHFSVELLHYADAIMHLCCVIANGKPPLIRGVRNDD